MTLVVAWTRTVGNVNELIVASDSRLTGGGYVDFCPKVFALPRADSALAFCGDTSVAYPFVLQAQNFVSAYLKASSRGQDLLDLRHSMVELLNQFRGMYENVIEQDFQNENETTEFILAGWSWREQRFDIRKLVYQRDLGRYSHRPASVWRGQGDNGVNRGKVLAIAGDYRRELRDRLLTLLRQRGRLGVGGFDMEPFEVLRDMLREPQFIERTSSARGRIGGAPQILKIYPHPNVLPVAVYWGADRAVHLQGRPLMSYEKTTFPIIDPDTLKVTRPLEAIQN